MSLPFEAPTHAGVADRGVDPTAPRQQGFSQENSLSDHPLRLAAYGSVALWHSRLTSWQAPAVAPAADVACTDATAVPAGGAVAALLRAPATHRPSTCRLGYWAPSTAVAAAAAAVAPQVGATGQQTRPPVVAGVTVVAHAADVAAGDVRTCQRPSWCPPRYQRVAAGTAQGHDVHVSRQASRQIRARVAARNVAADSNRRGALNTAVIEGAAATMILP